ncbi:hypothetical protein CAP48_05250 [Advenella sp. S44]|nr:hypothetical protein CAP48_05250 [Advenella sp. S44]
MLLAPASHSRIAHRSHSSSYIQSGCFARPTQNPFFGHWIVLLNGYNMPLVVTMATVIVQAQTDISIQSCALPSWHDRSL